jgi:hypothetical protein
MVLGDPAALGEELSQQIAANTRAAARLNSGSAMTQPQDGDDQPPGKLSTYTLAREASDAHCDLAARGCAPSFGDCSARLPTRWPPLPGHAAILAAQRPAARGRPGPRSPARRRRARPSGSPVDLGHRTGGISRHTRPRVLAPGEAPTVDSGLDRAQEWERKWERILLEGAPSRSSPLACAPSDLRKGTRELHGILLMVTHALDPADLYAAPDGAWGKSGSSCNLARPSAVGQVRPDGDLQKRMADELTGCQVLILGGKWLLVRIRPSRPEGPVRRSHERAT